MYVRIYMYIYIYMYVMIYVYEYIYMCVYIYIYIYLCICIMIYVYEIPEIRKLYIQYLSEKQGAHAYLSNTGCVIQKKFQR